MPQVQGRTTPANRANVVRILNSNIAGLRSVKTNLPKENQLSSGLENRIIEMTLARDNVLKLIYATEGFREFAENALKAGPHDENLKHYIARLDLALAGVGR